MHCHLKQCLLDYGPASSFWLFAFERMNGCLGSFHTNNQAVEVQLLRKFLSKQKVFHENWPDVEMVNLIKPLLNECSLKDTTSSIEFYAHILDHSNPVTISAMNNCCKLLPPIKKKCFSSSDLNTIYAYFTSAFGERYCRTLILHKQSKSAYFNGELYRSFFSRRKNSLLVFGPY